MTNKSNNSKNFFDSMLEAQTQTMDTMVETAKKLTNGNSLLNETLEKGTAFYKKTVDATKETINKVADQAKKVQEEAGASTNNLNNYFNNWKGQQTDMANQLKEMNEQYLKFWMNPGSMQNYFQTLQSNWTNMMNQNNMNNMFQQTMNSMNPNAMQENMNKMMEQSKSFWSQFQQVMAGNFSDMAKNLENGTVQDSFKGMINMADGFNKFYEMWMPMMKSMQDKTFNMDFFKNNLDMGQYKAFMDKYFSFMPQTSQEYVTNMKNMLTEGYKQNKQMMNDAMGNMKSSMENMFPQMFGNPFTIMMNGYNQMYQQMTSSVNPFAKLMTPNNDTKTMEAWNNIINNMNIYNIKNAELQYMIYETGMKVMENIAETTMHKVENGEEVNNMMKLYQEWLNLSDSQYVKMFETDEYSKLMAEVSSLQMRIKKDIELQMEKAFVNLPLSTKSDMDEVYQTIYDLKKEVRALQAQLAGNKTNTAKAAPVKKVAVKAAPAKKAVKKAVVAKKTTKRK